MIDYARRPSRVGGLATRSDLASIAQEVERGRVPPQRGFNRTTRGSFTLRRDRPTERTWPGYALAGGAVWHDEAYGACPYSSYTAIEDNSTDEAKTWLVLTIGVTEPRYSYEDGPPPDPLPDNQEWWLVADIIEPPRVPRFG